MLVGSWPQSWMHSYWCSPSPRMGFLEPDLLSPLMKNGTAAAAPAVRNVRRVVSLILVLPSCARSDSESALWSPVTIQCGVVVHGKRNREELRTKKAGRSKKRPAPPAPGGRSEVTA